jgi:hypothetical protein
MSTRELDAAVGAAHEMTRQPGLSNLPPVAKVPVKAGAPVVKVDKSGHRVRLRNIDHALEGCISTHGGEERFRLEPNQWTIVSDDIYTMLRDKFYKPQTFSATDWNGDVNNPQRMDRVDQHQEYIVEFPEEHD